MQRIGMRLDQAVHLAVSRALVLALPFVVCDGVNHLLAALTPNDWSGYMLWLGVGSLFEIWARTSAVCVLRGGTLARALGAALRRPGACVVFATVACLEPWANPFDTDLAWLATSLIASLAIFAALLALADSVSDDVPPLRALAFWLREVCRPSRLWINVVGALTVSLLMFGVPWVLDALPLPDWPVIRAVLVVPEALADTIAMVFAVLWRDERRGHDLELLLDSAQDVVITSPRASSPGSMTSQ